MIFNIPKTKKLKLFSLKIEESPKKNGENFVSEKGKFGEKLY
jgi:hypothetical protein